MIERGLALTLILVLGHLTVPPAAEAQQAGKVWKIGFLGPSPAGTGAHLVRAFQQGLGELGYMEGRNIAIEYRPTEPGDYERYRLLAAELVGLRVDVLVKSITPAALAAKKATTTIPVVMVNVDDPVESGLVASLSRPGGNVTGQAGGLMSYAPNSTDNYRRAAAYVDKILRGAQPGDLRVQQPTKFELAINLKTAKTLGLAIPKSLLLRADQVIE